MHILHPRRPLSVNISWPSDRKFSLSFKSFCHKNQVFNTFACQYSHESVLLHTIVDLFYQHFHQDTNSRIRTCSEKRISLPDIQSLNFYIYLDTKGTIQIEFYGLHQQCNTT